MCVRAEFKKAQGPKSNDNNDVCDVRVFEKPKTIPNRTPHYYTLRGDDSTKHVGKLMSDSRRQVPTQHRDVAIDDENVDGEVEDENHNFDRRW